MSFWPENFIPSLQANSTLTLIALGIGLAIAVALKWRTLRDLWRGPDEGE